MKKTKKKIYAGSLILKILVILAAVFTLVMLGYLIVYILAKGIPHLTPSLFSIHYDSDNVSMLPSIINTLIMIGVALLIAVPVGVFSAVYLTEYAKKGNKLVKVIRTTAETLTGIPSIVYGLFGMLFFVTACHMSYSLMAGILTVAIMVLPTVLRTTEEALLAVPDSTVREVSGWVQESFVRYFGSCFQVRYQVFFPVLFFLLDESPVRQLH